ALGMRRFVLKNYELNPKGYYEGNIKFLDDRNIDFDKAKLQKTVDIYNNLVETVYKGTVKKIDTGEMKWLEGKRSFAFFMAEKCGLSLAERQQLLEISTENKRLDFIMNYFDDVVPKIKEADKISNIIKGDGYIQ
ncbi:MAG: LON peptidase substrate-binding domain-containing protein, partial [bacterium]